MTTPTDLARLAAEESLDDDERRRLIEACGDDEELAAFVAAYRDVHALTGLALAAAARRRRERRRLRIAVAAAAACLALAAVAIGLSMVPRDADVTLASIPLAAPPAVTRTQPPLREDATAALASWPGDAGASPRWLTSMDEAQAIAAATRRPLLLFVHHPECPWCVAMNRITWPDARVSELTAGVVPVKVNVEETSREFQQQLTGWPYLALEDAGGKVLREFPGYREADSMSAELRSGLSLADLEAALPWDEARRLAAALASGREAEEQGRLGAALAAYEALFGAPAAFAEEARDGARRIAERARRELLRAHRLAPEDAAGALERLEDAEEAFRGTPHAEDLRRVRESLARTGRFPRLSPFKGV